MGLGDPEARELETGDYPALFDYPNQAKFKSTFFKTLRESPFKTEVAYDQSLILKNHDVV